MRKLLSVLLVLLMLFVAVACDPDKGNPVVPEDFTPEKTEGVVISESTKLEGESTDITLASSSPAGEGATTLSIPSGIVDGAESAIVTIKATKTEDAMKASSDNGIVLGALDIDLYINKKADKITKFAEGKVITVKTTVAKGLTKDNILIEHADGNGTVTEYDATTGTLTFTVSHLSEYKIVSKDAVACDSKKETFYSDLTSAISGSDSICLLKNIEIKSAITFDKDITIDLNKKTVTVKDGGSVKIGNGSIVIKNSADGQSAFTISDVVAEIGDTYFSSLSKAIDSASAEDTIKLLSDITLTSAVKIGSKDAAQKTLTINMNGKTISGETSKSNRTSLFDICNAKVTFDGEGTIQDTGKYFGEIMVRGSANSTDTDYTVVTVNKDITCKDGQAVWVDTNSDNVYSKNYGIVVNFYGKVDMKETVDYAFYVQGKNAEKIDNAPVFNIEGATIETKGEGIYAAGYSKWNIKNTKITTATNGINIAAGELTIGDDASDTTEIVAASTKKSVDITNGSTSTTIAAAVHVKQHTTKLPVTVTINGGKFSGYAPFNWEKGQSGTNAETITISIKGGTFESNSTEGSASVMSECGGKFIEGGTFSTNPSTFVADNFEAKQNGNVWTVAAKAESQD